MVNERDMSDFPGAAEEERTHRDRHCALWAFAGSAEVVVAGEPVNFGVGQCLVVPADSPYRITVLPGGLVVPVLIPQRDVAFANGGPVVVPVDPSWNTWVLHHFAAWVSPMRSADYTGDELLSGLGGDDGPLCGPSVPATLPAREVAETIRRWPGDTRTIRDLADQAGVCAQTLRRHFLREVGMTPGEWRAAVRLHAAREYLSAGYPVEWTAHHVGFGTSGGFIRAFSGKFGTTPARWCRAVRVGGTGERVAEEERNRRFVESLQEAAPFRTRPPRIPAARAVRRTYPGHHVVLWVYRGTARVHIDENEHVLAEGDAVWMPAGHSHEVEVDAGSVALPMSFPLDLVEISVEDVVVTRVPRTLTRYMLHNVVSNITRLRPVDYDPLEVLGVFGDLLHRRRDMLDASARLPVTPAPLAMARDTLDNLADARTTAQWAAELGVSSRTVNRWFRTETGSGYVRWRTRARIIRATQLLDRGSAPSAVSRKVGYRHLSGFSRDFRELVGMSPGEFASSGSTVGR